MDDFTELFARAANGTLYRLTPCLERGSYAEGRQQGLREAAEIARRHAADHGESGDPWHDGARTIAAEITASIEVRAAKEK